MSASSIHCGSFFLSPGQLLASSFGKVGWPSGWPYQLDLSTLTHRGREAVWRALSALRLNRGDHVLVPSYHCGSEVDVLVKAGLKIELYQVDERGAVIEEDLLSRLGPDVRMIYITHMFGWPQSISHVRKAARELGCLILEDCALSLFSFDGDSPIGSNADAAVFSFPKSLAVPDGGALVLSRPFASDVGQLRNAPRSRVLRRTLGLLRSYFESTRWGHAILPKRHRKKKTTSVVANVEKTTLEQRPDIPSKYYFDSATADCGISRISQRILSKIDPQEIFRRRRQNYLWMVENLAGIQGIEIWNHELKEGVCPLVMPILVKNSLDVATYLEEKGVSCSAWWWGFHRGFDYNGYEMAVRLKSSVVALPIHQDLVLSDLEYVVGTIRDYFKQKSSLKGKPTHQALDPQDPGSD